MLVSIFVVLVTTIPGSPPPLKKKQGLCSNSYSAQKQFKEEIKLEILYLDGAV